LLVALPFAGARKQRQDNLNDSDSKFVTEQVHEGAFFVIEVHTSVEGFVSVVFFRSRDQELLFLWAEEIDRYSRACQHINSLISNSAFQRAQKAVGLWYASDPVQIAVAILIFGNFIANAAQSELVDIFKSQFILNVLYGMAEKNVPYEMAIGLTFENCFQLPKPGTAEDRFFSHLDLAFTYLFTAELAVNLLANWYVCLHVYVHVCSYICIFVCVFVCLYVCLSVCIFVCMYAVLPYLFVWDNSNLGYCRCAQMARSHAHHSE